MKKIIVSAAFLGLFILFGNNVSAQASENIVNEIEVATKAAVSLINDNSSLNDADKKKFIARFEANAKYSKAQEDSKAKTSFNDGYKRLADNYNRITGKTLPALTAKEEK